MAFMTVTDYILNFMWIALFSVGLIVQVIKHNLRQIFQLHKHFI